MQGTALPKAERVESPSSRYYQPELDALRFFAFVCVFSFHSAGYLALRTTKLALLDRYRLMGSFGVQVFFLLSAFLITELLLRERERTGRIHIQSFYMRRILRIWPLYFAAFFGLALLNRFVHHTGTEDPRAWMAFTFLCGNWYIIQHGWIAGPVDPLWSISIEEQFYLIVPLLAFFGGRRAVLFTAWILLGIAYVVLLFYGLHPNVLAEWLNSFVQFQFFCAGTLLALFRHGRTLSINRWIRFAGFLSGLLCWIIAVALGFGFNQTLSQFIASWLCVLLGAAVLFLSVLGTSPRLIPQWLSYLGKISYGLYVFHSLLLVLVFRLLGKISMASPLRGHVAASAYREFGVIAALVLDLILAHLSFVYFEGFFLRLKRRFTFVPTRD